MLDVIARLLDHAGESSNTVSAYTQVKMEDAPRFVKIPKSECPFKHIYIYGYVFHDTKWPESWSNIEDPVVLLERNLYGHPLAGLLWERQFEEVLLGLGWGKSTAFGNVCLFIDTKDDSYRYTWMT